MQIEQNREGPIWIYPIETSFRCKTVSVWSKRFRCNKYTLGLCDCDSIVAAPGFLRYKDGHDHMGEHRDDERELDPLCPIASVSLGAVRDFVFRHRESRGKQCRRQINPVKLELAHGSLLLMNSPTNTHWYHSLPARKRVLTPRINLTFRRILQDGKKWGSDMVRWESHFIVADVRGRTI